MPRYRLYYHDAKGHFRRAQNISVIDDAAALEAAQTIGHTHSIEVWQEKRQIGTADPLRPDPHIVHAA